MNHSEWARTVKDRDGWICQEPGCRATENLHAHHIKPVALGGQNTLENGITLCEKHHRARHRGALSTRSMGSQGHSIMLVKGVSAPQEWWDKVDGVATGHHTSRSVVIRTLVSAYLEKKLTGRVSEPLARLVRTLTHREP